jgi:hypothetical protein
VIDEALSHHTRHELGGVVLPLSSIEAQCEREGTGEVFRSGARKAIGRIGHAMNRSAKGRTRQEQLKEHGFAETEASVTNKLARATMSAHFFLASLAAIGKEGLSLQEL